MGGSILFNLEQRGLYITLLCLQWDHGHVTEDEWLSLSSAMAQPMAKHVLAKFTKGSDGLFRNARMEEERAKQAEFRANRSESGKVGANKRWHSHSTAIAQPMDSHAFANSKPIANDSSPSPSPSSSTPVQGELEPPPGFPKTEAEAIAHCAFVGATAESAITAYHKAVSRGFTDASGRPIHNFRSYLKTEQTYADDRKAREQRQATGKNTQQRVDRNIGTANEGRASEYAGVGRLVKTKLA